MVKEKLTIERVKELAMQNYNKGGDGIVECYEDYQIQELIDSGVNTETKLMNFFKDSFAIDEEKRKAALYYGYGTTDKEEITRIEQENAKLLEEILSDVAEESYDSCAMCAKYDGGYNCKHCKYGDDGRYESPFDVYTPAELGINVK